MSEPGFFTRRYGKNKDESDSQKLPATEGPPALSTEASLKVGKLLSHQLIVSDSIFHLYFAESQNLGKIIIKLVRTNGEQAVSLLKSERAVFGRIKHKHLLEVHEACCSEPFLDSTAQSATLIYHLSKMSDQVFTLRSRIEESPLPPLTSAERIQIIQEIAKALSFLHCDLSQPIVHRDINSTGILLIKTQSGKLVTKLADLSLGIETPEEVEGTWIFEADQANYRDGYTAPEYLQNQRGTKSIDVYAFGVVILELLTGLSAFDKFRANRSLVTHVLTMSDSDKPLLGLVDPLLKGDYDAKQFQNLFDLALKCCDYIARRRPDIQQVLKIVQST